MKDIKNYEGHYQIDEVGNVWSVKSKKFLKPGINECGYKYVILCKNGKRKNYKVHRLVAEAFIPNPDNLPQVNHRNEDKLDNSVENLEWVSHIDNIRYGTGIRRSYIKRCKPVLQYTLDGEFVREWESANEAGRNGYCCSSINRCCLNKYKKYKNYIWKYKNEEDN